MGMGMVTGGTVLPVRQSHHCGDRSCLAYAQLQVVMGAIPSTAAWVDYDEAPVHVVASSNDFLFNFG